MLQNLFYWRLVMVIPRSEHPNPQFMRENWLCLNGQWSFILDNKRVGKKKHFYNEEIEFGSNIIVPFCPQSKLSGVIHKDFIKGMWYQKKIVLTKEQLEGRVLIHFGAVDYRCEIYVNGNYSFSHKGGYVSFSGEITKHLREGENTLTVYVEDNERDALIPTGKQSEKSESYGCLYTRTTGIWQSVWLEFVPCEFIKKIKIYTDISTPSVTIITDLCGKGKLTFDISYKGRNVGHTDTDGAYGEEAIIIPLAEKHLWEAGNGRLYDVEITFGKDKVKSYFGLRRVDIDGYKVLINGKSVFQRLILDQGFYPNGIYTAPTDAELMRDIQRSLNCGFNGARLHQKVFEPRFLYHADKMGYLVWGEYPNWGLDYSDPRSVFSVLPEWLEEVDRDFNHPSIIGWCPFNETWDYHGKKQDNEVLRTVYLATKAADSTRPCIDTSGNYHVQTDIYDLHDYDQNPVTFKERYLPFEEKGELIDNHAKRQTYTKGLPVFISEYGGIKWSPDRNDGWGYGNAPKTEAEFIERYKGLTDALLDNSKMFGFCYTQLTDVEQEQNGLYTYDRKPKFDVNILHAITSRKAKIEEE